MKIQIKHRFSRAVLFETDAETIGAAIVAALAAKARLVGANLDRANLVGANLDGANLDGASLDGARLVGANLDRASLVGASLVGASLVGASLDGASLDGANLDGANLDGANLVGANLDGASLVGASLVGASLVGANLVGLLSRRTILPDGDLIGWKKLVNGVICKLKIPADAKRVGGLIGRKCRAEFADVIEGEGRSIHNAMEYKVGQRVTPDSYDPDPLVECSHGIHFFITREEARVV